MSSRLSEEPLDLVAVRREVNGSGGATCLFAGTVRRTNRGKEVVSLSYEAHRALGERVLRELEEEAEAAAAVRGCRIVHRVGTLEVGEASVAVAVAAESPDAAVGAARRTMDQLKERVPMWKEERYADGATRFLDGSPLHSGGDGTSDTPGEDGVREGEGGGR